MQQSSTLEKLIQQCRDLYSLPAVAMQVLELASQPHATAEQLKQCLELDPALTGKVLRVVNSSLFGLTREVSDLGQAVALLGIQPLRLLVLGFSLPDALFASVAGDVLNGYWKHTLTRAVAARELAASLGPQAADEAFLAGLLRDLGQLVLIQQVGTSYVEFWRRVRASGANLAEMEQRILGFDSREVTVRLLEHWGLPATLLGLLRGTAQNASQTHGRRPLAAYVELADLVATLLADQKLDVLIELINAAPGMEQAIMAERVAGLEKKVAQLAEVLSLDLPDGLAFTDVLLRAQKQLAVAASDAAGEMLKLQHETMAARVESLMLLEEVRSLTTAIAEAIGPNARPRSPQQSARETSPAQNGATHQTPHPGAPQNGAAKNNVLHIPAPRPTAPDASRTARTRSRSTEQLEESAADPGLLGRLRVAATHCRQQRAALSLLLVEIDHYEELAFTSGVDRANEYLWLLEAACENLPHSGHVAVQIAEARFAIVLPECDRREATELGSQLLTSMHRVMAGALDTPPVSIGVACVEMPPRNFLPEELLRSANRCLYAARTTGGNAVKSIEV